MGVLSKSTRHESLAESVMLTAPKRCVMIVYSTRVGRSRGVNRKNRIQISDHRANRDRTRPGSAA